MRRFTRILLSFFAASLPALPLAAGTAAADEIVFVDLSQLATPPHQVTMTRGPLPGGPVSEPVQVLGAPLRTFATPSGQLLAFSHLSFPERNILFELKPDGTMREIATVFIGGYSSSLGSIKGLAGDGRGRLYLLHSNAVTSDPSYPANGLYEIDPATGYLGKALSLPGSVRTIASAPDGLWALAGGFLRRLDPDTGALGPPIVNLDAAGAATDLAGDSAGRVYFLRPCAAPQTCRRLSIYDPANGALTDAPPELQAAIPGVGDFAISWGDGPPAAVYLGGSRFRAEIDYEGYDGAAGQARLAPARSRDTGIFYFFDEDNWELMVKVLNGCSINTHFWVYAAASTDVEYTMTITDIYSGEQKVYRNPLGQVAVTVTDGQAFFCTF